MDATYWQKLGERAVAAGFEWCAGVYADGHVIESGEHRGTFLVDTVSDGLPFALRSRTFGPRGRFKATRIFDAMPRLDHSGTLGAYTETLRKRAGDETLDACCHRARNGALRWFIRSVDPEATPAEQWATCREEAWVAFAEWLKEQGR